MKQIIVISGKGGTGKTTVASSFAHLAKNRHVADCDVEAPNLNMILEHKVVKTKKYIGGQKAHIDKTKCIECGLCRQHCRFDAITPDIEISSKCEGCGVCEFICPTGAIEMIDDETGQIITGNLNDGKFSYAELNIGADGAGKLVTEVRKAIMENSDEAELAIIDGSPGIGCVVIASVTGCDVAVAVTEPTQSGLSDLKRVLSLVDFFGITPYVIINKYDINEDKTKEIEEYCNENKYEILGKIPFDPFVSKAIKENKPIVEYEDSIAGSIIKNTWELLNKRIRR